MSLQDKWNALLRIGVSEQTLQIVTDINGYSDDTLEDVLFAVMGTRDFEDIPPKIVFILLPKEEKA